MQYLYLLVLVAKCQGLAVRREHEETVPAPKLLGLTAHPPALTVQWEPVHDVPGSDPIKGYKILVWKLRPVQDSKYKLIDGIDTLVKKFRAPTLTDTGTSSEKYAMKFVVSDPLVSKVRVSNIKFNSIYEVRIRAFTKSKEGPLSSHLSIQALDEKH